MRKKNIYLGDKKNFWTEGKYLGVIAVLSVFIIWFLLTREGLALIRSIKLPSPLMVVKALIRLKQVILFDMGATIARVLVGLSAGLILGILFGLLISFCRKLYNFLNPLIESIRPVPIIAMIPFFLMWFGIAELGKFLLVVLGVVNIMLVGTVEAVKNVPPIYINAAKTLGADKKQIFLRIITPAITEELLGPIRVAAALTFTLVVAAEFMGAQYGLGFRILDARRLFSPDIIFLGILIIGIAASLIDQLIQRSMSYVLRWSERSEK